MSEREHCVYLTLLLTVRDTLSQTHQRHFNTTSVEPVWISFVELMRYVSPLLLLELSNGFIAIDQFFCLGFCKVSIGNLAFEHCHILDIVNSLRLVEQTEKS